jgi:hypothetical protein
MSTTGWLVLGIAGVGAIWLLSRQQTVAQDPGQAFLGGLLNGLVPQGPGGLGQQVGAGAGSLLNSIFGGGNPTGSNGGYAGGSGGPNSGNGYYDDPGSTGFDSGGVGSGADTTGNYSGLV